MTTSFPRDDEPLDLGAVSRDEELLEALRLGDAEDALVSDPALAALSALLDDVGEGLSEPAVLPAREAAPAPALVVPLARRRSLSRVAMVAAVGVGVLSVGGVAAANPGSPLRPVRDAVASVVGAGVEDLVAAMTPDEPFDPSGERRRSAASPTPSPSASPTSVAAPATTRATTAAPAPRPVRAGARSPQATPGASVAAASTSRAAADRVAAALARAEEALDRGRLASADAHLDTAERALPDVSTADGRAALQEQYEALRTRLAEARSASPPASATASPRADEPAATRSPRPSRSARAEKDAEAEAEVDEVRTPAPRSSKAVRTPASAVEGKAAGRS